MIPMFDRSNFTLRAFATAIPLITAGSAAAQSANINAVQEARTLVEAASRLMDAGKFAQACPKLERATLLVPEGIGAKMALGECYVGAGRLASAWEQYSRAELLAVGLGDHRAADARSEISKLLPHLARVMIVVPDWMYELNGLSIRVDGSEFERSLWESPIHIDTGPHIIEVEAPGLEPWRKSIEIEPLAILKRIDIPDLHSLNRIPQHEPHRNRQNLSAPTRPIESGVHDNSLSLNPQSIQISSVTGNYTFLFKKPLAYISIGSAALGLGAAGATFGYLSIAGSTITPGPKHQIEFRGIVLGATSAPLMIWGLILLAMPSNNNVTANNTVKRGELHISVSPNGLGLHGTW